MKLPVALPEVLASDDPLIADEQAFMPLSWPKRRHPLEKIYRKV
jgi:hypothetical protein